MSAKSRQKPLPSLPGFFDQFAKESDRAAGILGAALLDLQLERLFRNRLHPTTPDSVFQYRGPLGDFAARIDLALALGWIDSDAHADLHTVRRIRNDFAHSADHELTFADPSIDARTRKLKTTHFLSESASAIADLIPDVEGKADAVAETMAFLQKARALYSGAVTLLGHYLLTITMQPCAAQPPLVSLRGNYDATVADQMQEMRSMAEAMRKAVDQRK